MKLNKLPYANQAQIHLERISYKRTIANRKNILKGYIIVLLLFFINGCLFGQVNSLLDKEYSIYDFLINGTIVQIDTDIIHLDSMKIYPEYLITIVDSTVGNQYAFPNHDTNDKVYTFHDDIEYATINKNKYFIEKNKLKIDKPKYLKKGEKEVNIKIEFSRCSFYSRNNHEYAIVYYGTLIRPLGGAGYLMVLQSDGRNWKIVRKIRVWVS